MNQLAGVALVIVVGLGLFACIAAFGLCAGWGSGKLCTWPTLGIPLLVAECYHLPACLRWLAGRPAFGTELDSILSGLLAVFFLALGIVTRTLKPGFITGH